MKQFVVTLFIIICSFGFAIAQKDNVGVSLYPVPLKENQLTVQMKTSVTMKSSSVELRNFIGKKLQEVKIDGRNEVQFNDMRQYPEGVYVIVVKDPKGKIVETAKFLITK